MDALPTLYKKTSSGAIENWRIDAGKMLDDRGLHYVGVITTTWGQVGSMNPQQAIDIITEGKNLGKSNSTTPAGQAEREVLSQWEKKLKKGYVQSIEAAEAGEVDEIVEGGVLPMLAHRFDQHGEKLEYPCFVQPKLDGHRCIAIIKDGKATLWSRTRKRIPGYLPHIVSALELMASRTGLRNITVDGELYNHNFHGRFEELTHYLRDASETPGYDQVQYHIYDVVLDQPQRVRLGYLTEIADGKTVIKVDTREIRDEDQLLEDFERCLAMGYEGAIARNAMAKYVNKRSYDLLKIKKFDDAEFEVISVEDGRGKMAGKAVFNCITIKGRTYPAGEKTFTAPEAVDFAAKLKGKIEDLAKYFQNPKLAVGRMMTVQYQGFTKYNKPRFPVALRFHEEV